MCVYTGYKPTSAAMVKNSPPMLRHQHLAIGGQSHWRYATPLMLYWTLPAWVRRYLLAEVVGLLVALANITLAGRLTDNAFLLVAVSVYGGAVGYYSTLFLSLFFAARRATQRAGGIPLPYSRWRKIRTLLMTLGSAEMVDSLLLSPLLLYLALHLLPNHQLAVVVSEVVSTLMFYGTLTLVRRADAGRLPCVRKGES